MPRLAPRSYDVLGQRDHLLGGEHQQVLRRSVGALPRGLPHPDPLAYLQVYARPDRIDRPGAVLMQDDPERLAGALAAAHLAVGRVDPGDVDVDAHLTGSGLRGRPVRQAQHLGAAGLLCHDGAMRCHGQMFTGTAPPRTVPAPPKWLRGAQRPVGGDEEPVSQGVGAKTQVEAAGWSSAARPFRRLRTTDGRRRPAWGAAAPT